jgi:hypothetical protein
MVHDALRAAVGLGVEAGTKNTGITANSIFAFVDRKRDVFLVPICDPAPTSQLIIFQAQILKAYFRRGVRCTAWSLGSTRAVPQSIFSTEESGRYMRGAGAHVLRFCDWKRYLVD